jgi:hypothetical protein
MPPFANGALVHVTSTYSSAKGDFVQALLYQPDQVKRSTSSSGSKLLIKQKGSVGFRIGTWDGTGGDSNLHTVIQAPGCKGQASFVTKTKAKSSVYKFKMSCGKKDPKDQQVRDALEAFFGTPRNSFSLFRDTSKPL